MKVIKWVVATVILLMLIAIVVVYVNLNSIVRSTVEAQATQSMSLETSVGAARLSLMRPTLSLSDIRITSPAGYAGPDLISLAGINVAVRVRELFQNPVRISQLELNRPLLLVERAGVRLNIREAMEGMGPSERRLIVEQFDMRDATVLVRPDLPEATEEIAVTLPRITVKNVGTGPGAENGVAISEVVMQVAAAMLAMAAESDDIPEEVRAMLTTDTQEIAARMGEEFRRRIDEITRDARSHLPDVIGEEIEEFLLAPRQD